MQISGTITVIIWTILDEMNEVTYLKKYYNYFDKGVSKFVSSDLIRDDKFYEVKLSALKAEK